jgi:P27 family predicted phage terminase small subunit
MGERGPLGKVLGSAPARGRLLRVLPKPPKGLGAEGRAEWKRAAAELGPKGRNVLTEAAVGLLEDLARLADDATEFRKVWKDEGHTVVGKGREFAHPMIAAEREARQGILRLRRELGVTPASVARVPSGPSPEKPAGEDPLDEFD